jgi:hypothetical protein
MDVLQPYCNQDGTVPYAADTVDVQRRQKCCNTTELPDMPVRNEMEDVELTRRRPLVRTQHRPLGDSDTSQAKRRTKEVRQAYPGSYTAIRQLRASSRVLVRWSFVSRRM